MTKDQIISGHEYALFQPRPNPYHRVRIIERARRGKWRVLWIRPNRGLVDFVRSEELVCEWKDQAAVRADERHSDKLEEHNAHVGFGPFSAPIADAFHDVFESTGELGIICYNGRVTAGHHDVFNRIMTRAVLPANDPPPPPAYHDRFGRLHLPFDQALALAQAFCRNEPATVLGYIDQMEAEFSRDAEESGQAYRITHLNKCRPSWALIRQWAGHEAAKDAYQARLRRYEKLLADALFELKKAGLVEPAERLQRALEGR